MAKKQEVKLTKKDFEKEREDGRKPHQKYKFFGSFNCITMPLPS